MRDVVAERKRKKKKGLESPPNVEKRRNQKGKM